MLSKGERESFATNMSHILDHRSDESIIVTKFAKQIVTRKLFADKHKDRISYADFESDELLNTRLLLLSCKRLR